MHGSTPRKTWHGRYALETEGGEQAALLRDVFGPLLFHPVFFDIESLDRIARSGDNDYRRYLLAECLQAYSDLDPAEWQRLR